ncbi:MAG: FtsW/RodA/SpoVE family cell cycle protein [Anaerolineales bacterium]|nr:FtsW/RodA/SpoVE family cell cycle protein [Anaerolineales bacterium]
MLTNTSPNNISEINRREAYLLCLAFVLMLLGAIAQAIAPAARIGVWDVDLINFRYFLVLPVWIACAFVITRTLRNKLHNRDPFLLPIGLLLSGWGLLVIWRLTPTFGLRQTGWLLVASLALLVTLFAPKDLKWLKQYRYLWLLGGIGLTALTLLFGTNPSGAEPRLWLGCCGLYFQPSEPLRLLLVAFLASYFAERMAFQWVDKRPPLLATLVPLVIIWSISILLLFVQRDLGTGTLFLALLAVLLYVASSRWQPLAIAAVLILIGGVVGSLLFEVVQTRLEAWLNPWLDPIGGSYQLVQSLIAVASGGIAGRGPGLGAPGFVPAAHTDFIFAAVAEEWGFIGALAIIVLFAILISRGIKIATRSKDPFNRMLAVGIAIAFGLQTILIVGGVIRLLPLTGVTLPFVSYGGSSLLTSFLALALLILLSNSATAQADQSRELRVIQIGLGIALLGLAATLGWWSVVRSEGLADRTDNPRRTFSERYSKRGQILDSNGHVLSESTGSRGNYERIYYADSASPVIGYDSAPYGLAGIESSMDAELRGNAAVDPWVKAWSYFIRGVPPPGSDIRLTLNLNVQETTARALEDLDGTVVVLDREGNILALGSSPTFNSSTIEDDWIELTARDDAPLLNRATQSRYQPGLTLAPFLTAWGVDSGKLELSAPAENPLEVVNFEGQDLTCTLDAEEGFISLANALGAGCPGAFAAWGNELGETFISDTLLTFGLDELIEIRLEIATPSEFSPLDEEDALMRESLGQGTFTVTPLHVARGFLALATDGSLPSLRLVNAIRNPEGGWETLPDLQQSRQAISPETALQIQSAFNDFGGGLVGFSYVAVGGPGGDILTWFLGTDENGHVVIVVLEGIGVETAEEIGRMVLETAAAPSTP